MAAIVLRAAKANNQVERAANRVGGNSAFPEEVLVLVVAGTYFTAVKWAAFKPMFHGPVKIVRASHTCYELL